MSYPPPPPNDPSEPGGTTPPPYGSSQPGYGPPGPPEYPYPAGGGYAVPASNQKALWALILGIFGLLCCGVASIAALVLGILAKNEIRASRGTQSGEGQAQAGFILGIIGCAFWALGIVAYAGLAIVSSANGY
jgi:hypothetical protein